uniref:Uncharacterized protein n=1 Tax=Arundo donax TaxID=35708 RepID=A0A0A9AHV1_ARUDO
MISRRFQRMNLFTASPRTSIPSGVLWSSSKVA